MTEIVTFLHSSSCITSKSKAVLKHLSLETILERSHFIFSLQKMYGSNFQRTCTYLEGILHICFSKTLLAYFIWNKKFLINFYVRWFKNKIGKSIGWVPIILDIIFTSVTYNIIQNKCLFRKVFWNSNIFL